MGLRRSRQRERGQSLVEFAVALPVFMLLLFGMLEFGLAFNQHLTLEYATREGARVGSALADLGGVSPCATRVDREVVAAVQRVLESGGSAVAPAKITRIRIFRADSQGRPISGDINVWGPGSSTGDGISLKFKETGNTWGACGRDNGASPDSIGVSLDYTYDLATPLGVLMRMGPGATFPMYDQTVMALNPTNN